MFGEFELIDKIYPLFKSLVGSECRGIGDDCAVIPLNSGMSQIVTTDMLVEDVHFLRSGISPFELGAKSLTVSLSDIAAMGGDAQSSFMSIALPADISQEWIQEFLAGYKSVSEQFNVALLGGDTCGSKHGIIINVLVLGVIDNKRIKYRSGAKIGDSIFVSGSLGASAAGLQALTNNLNEPELIYTHHNPRAYLAEGKWLGEHTEVGAMMDISDGVASDIHHILKASGVGAEIFTDRIPIAEDVVTASALYGWDQLRLALCGGEDYKLLFTASQESSQKIEADYYEKFGDRIYEIGKITESGFRWLSHGEPIDIEYKGFTHF